MNFIENYWGLIVAITLIIEVTKRYFPKNIQTKWSALVVAAVLCIVYSLTKYFDGHYVNLVISFGLAVLFYDYIFKVAKDLLMTKLNNIGNQDKTK